MLCILKMTTAGAGDAQRQHGLKSLIVVWNVQRISFNNHVFCKMESHICESCVCTIEKGFLNSIAFQKTFYNYIHIM